MPLGYSSTLPDKCTDTCGSVRLVGISRHWKESDSGVNNMNGFKSKLELERKRKMGLFLDWSLLGLMAVFNLLERPDLWATCELYLQCVLWAGQCKVPVWPPSILRFLETNATKQKILENSLLYISRWYEFTCRGLILWKSVVGNLRIWFITQHTRICRSRPNLPFFRSHPNFSERCRPFTCVCVLYLVRICWGFPELFVKDSFLRTQSNYNTHADRKPVWFSAYSDRMAAA